MIGLIFGGESFPKKILAKIKKKKINFIIIDLTKKKEFKKEKKSYSASIGQFGKIIKLLKTYKCKNVIFAGKVKKPNFSKIKLDLKGVYYFPRIIKSSKLGDAAILKEIIEILKKEKINTISSLFFNPELTLSKGHYTKLKLNKQDLISINKGINSLGKLNAYNHTQGLVVKNKIIVAKETSSGTQKMIQSVKKLRNSKGILIKFPKRKQDLRVDLPTVGLDTLKDCKKAGLKGIVLKANQNIFLDKYKSIAYANKNKMFIKVL
tara:strand:- start:242 stop:1033 length:792 start_codon:yes stop_codon:yes gene_type:complete